MRATQLLVLLTVLISIASAQMSQHEAGNATLAGWQRLIDESRALTDAEKLSRVNDFFNERVRFGTDLEIWQQKDYWATPRETLYRGRGDCEDFVIAKYFTLINTGMSPEKLRLIYVRAQIGAASSGISQTHMVLGYYSTHLDEPQILDNLIGEIRPASRRADLTPVFSFNTEGLWAGGSMNLADPTTRLSRWRNVLQRIRQESSLPGMNGNELTSRRGD